MHLARERSVSADSKIRPLQSPTSLRRRVTITNRPEIVEFDPTLPPAAFPTLSEPRPRDRTASQNSSNGIQSPLVVDWISSNCGSNPTYTSNMAAMGAAGANGFNLADNLSISDSDDELVDDQEALGLKVSSISPSAYLKATENDSVDVGADYATRSLVLSGVTSNQQCNWKLSLLSSKPTTGRVCVANWISTKMIKANWLIILTRVTNRYLGKTEHWPKCGKSNWLI